MDHWNEYRQKLRSPEEAVRVVKSGDWVDYTVALDTAGHYLLVDLDLSGISGRVTLNMPRWTPGYYEMLDFPKHLCDFAAADVAGNAVGWEKCGMNRWKVAVPKDGRLFFHTAQCSHSFHRNRPGGTASGCDRFCPPDNRKSADGSRPDIVLRKQW